MPETPSLEPTRDWTDYGFMMLAFIVFTIAFAIVRAIYNNTMTKVPKDNWKSQFKRRLSSATNRNSDNKKDEEAQDTSIVKKGLGFLTRRSSNSTAEKKSRFDPELENIRVVEHASDEEGGDRRDDNDMGFETSSNESKNRGSMMN